TAQKVADELVERGFAAAGVKRGIRVQAIYGGRAFEPQVQSLHDGVEIVVGTPGRLLDLAQRGDLILGKVRVLVLDEADEMLDLGFLPDIERILGMIPDFRQTMLFSATMPGPIVTLARQFMRQPVHIRAEEPDEGRTVPETAQHIYRAHALDKTEMLARILQARERGLAMVFCRTKRTAQKVADELLERGFAAAAVHGDLGQGAREQALRAFRSGKVDVLVATDVAARGIDVTGVTHVINFQCPEDEKTYLHRIGRTGRAGASGVAVTFVDWDETPRWEMINKALDLPFADPPETYSTSEHLYAELDIPSRAAGTLPHRERTRAGLAAEEVEDLGETGRRRKGAAGPSTGSASGPAGDARGRRGRTTRRDDDERPARGRDDTPAEVTGDEPTRPKRTRARRRTRSGGAVAADGGAETLADAPSETPANGPADGPEDGSEAARTPRKRSRRKPAAGGSEPTGATESPGGTDPAAIADTGASASADAAASTDAASTDAAPAQNGSAPRTRTRTRGAIPQAETSSQEPVTAVRSADGPAPVMMFSAGDSTTGSTTAASRTAAPVTARAAAAPVTAAPVAAPPISAGDTEPAAKAPRRRTRRAADAAPDAAPAE
ncbi:MAG: hypothetical protein QOD41_2519, partial [Cryptosporangiaceae bacterium]|nr:hypothetical protein [Cryptosporangiaceae bacterium]